MDRKSNKKWVGVCVAIIISGLLIQVANILALIRNVEKTEYSFLNFFAVALNTIALIFALIYLVKGYKKSDAKFYKGFLAFYGISLLVSSACAIAFASYRPVVTRVIIPNYAMMYGVLMVLCFAEDLGEKKAMGFVWVNYALNAILLVALLITHPGYLRSGSLIDNAIDINVAKNFILSSILIYTTKCKYIDKTERGTK